MKQALDQMILRFVHGDLGLANRLRMRLELLASPAARRRAQEFDNTSDTLAAALSPLGGAAFHAGRAVRRVRLAIIDGIVTAAILGAIAAGTVWRMSQNQGEYCPPAVTAAHSATVVAQPLAPAAEKK